MSPLTYHVRFPPRIEHRVIDKQGVDWTARFDGVCLRPTSYDWRIRFERAGAERVGYVEPGTSLEHESFLRDILIEAEPQRGFDELTSGPLYDLVQEVVSARIPWQCGEKLFDRWVIRLDPGQVDVYIELTNHVFPAHRDSVREVIAAVAREIPVWRRSGKIRLGRSWMSV